MQTSASCSRVPRSHALSSLLLPSFLLSCREGDSGDTASSLPTLLGLVLSDISMCRVRSLLAGDRCFSGFKGNECEAGLRHLLAVPLMPRAFPSPPRLPSALAAEASRLERPSGCCSWRECPLARGRRLLTLTERPLAVCGRTGCQPCPWMLQNGVQHLWRQTANGHRPTVAPVGSFDHHTS